MTASHVWQNSGGLLVLSGGIFTLTATFLFLNSWWISVAEILVGALVLGSAAPSSCRGLLTWSHSDAGWRTAAALMDRASFNIYKTSLLQEGKAHAVCCTSLNTTLVLCACLAAYLVHWFERGQRLRYKGLVPPAVAAMQSHIYGLPLALVAAQALLMLLYPAMVLGWVSLGAWHGLRYFPAPL